MPERVNVPNALVKRAIRNIPKKTLKLYLESIGVNPIYELLDDPDYVLTFLTPAQARWITDNFLTNTPKVPIYMFELKSAPFNEFSELPEEILAKANKTRRLKKYPKEPTLQLVYPNNSYKQLVLRFVFKSPKVEEIINEETGKPMKYSRPIRVFVIFRANNPLVDVRGSRINATLVKKVLFKALHLLSLNDIPKRVYMNNIGFIKSLLDFASSVDYITLEFPGELLEEEEEPVPGKMAFSGRYGSKRTQAKDLRKYDTVMKAIDRAYKSGEITRAHLELTLPDKTIFDDIASFGINFRESKLYPFRAYSEKAINEMLKILYNVWKGGPYDDVPKRKQKWIDEFIS